VHLLKGFFLHRSFFDRQTIIINIQTLIPIKQLSTNNKSLEPAQPLQRGIIGSDSALNPLDFLKNDRAISVSALTKLIRQTIEQRYPLQWVSGEISGFTQASSGHWYFSLKDSEAQVRCAMFRGRNQRMNWLPKNGDAVELQGAPTLYEARGEFQIVVDQIRPAGQGALYEAFVKLKTRLEQEGLFDIRRKRSLPTHPRTIGIVTSLAAAALKDVLSTLARRAPHISVIIYPTPVQGAEAPPKICAAILQASKRNEVEVLIVCRGGGSLEDLWAFNDEQVARAIAQAPMPVVSGVGHETDFTIADFAADMRAPTPTAAAELCAPSKLALLDQLVLMQRRMTRTTEHQLDRLHHQLQRHQLAFTHVARRRLEDRNWALDRLASRLVHPRQAIAQQKQNCETLRARLQLQHPKNKIAALYREVSGLRERTIKAWSRSHEKRLSALERWEQALQLLDPGQVLQRGYSLVYAPNGTLLRTPQQVKKDDPLQIVLAEGTLVARAEP